MKEIKEMEKKNQKRKSIGRIEIEKGIEMIEMEIYNLGWDMEFFGYMEKEKKEKGGWKIFER